MLTPEQLQSVGGNPNPPSQTGPTFSSQLDSARQSYQSQPENQPSFLSRVGSDLSARGQNIQQTVNSTPNHNVGQALQGGLRIVGQVAGGINDVIGEGIKSIAPGIPKAIGAIAGTKPAQDIAQRYSDWAKQHPDAAKNLEAIVNIASLIPEGAGAKMAGESVAENAPKLAGELGDVGTKIGSKLGNAPADLKGVVQKSVTSIPENVKSMLQTTINPAETQKNLTKYFNIGKDAKATTGVATPLDVAGKNELGGALKDIKGQLAEAGKAKTAALAESGSKIVPIKDAYATLGKNLSERLGTAYDGAGNLVSTEGRQSLVIGNKADENIVKLAHDAIQDLRRTPTLQKVNDVVDRLQNQLYKSRVLGAEPITDQTKAVINTFTHDLNEAATKIGGDAYKTANDTYSQLRPIHDDLSNRLGSNMKNAGSVMKRIFSPQDGGTKDLVSKIEQITGRKINDHATLAKFAMDSLGDARAKSLLEKVPAGSGITMKIINGILEKMQNPEAVAGKMIRKVK